MKIIWARGSATVRDVYEALLARRKIAYTTVMTMMQILEGKGHLKRKALDRAYVYSPTQPKSRVVTAMVKDFVDRVFDGSAEHLLAQLIKEERLSPKDFQRIARIAQPMEEKP
jgi:BlaI family transcriptional regulator, penicillinase repressor